MPTRFCLSCKKLTTNGSRCPACQADLMKRVDAKRGSRQQRGYGSVWTKTSAAKLAEHRRILGEICPGWNRSPHPATDLTTDHITPKSAGGTDDPTNLQILCRACNSAKHNRTR
jgi:5-methylcytosine-specific restriction enzyme A